TRPTPVRDLDAELCETRTVFLPSITESALVELPTRRGLLGADPPRDDVGSQIVFAANRRTRHPPQHGDLADVRQCVGDRPLKELLGAARERCGRCEVRV